MTQCACTACSARFACDPMQLQVMHEHCLNSHVYSGESRMLKLAVPWFNIQYVNDKILIHLLKLWKNYTINYII
jgi:hypothetical protein